MEQRKPVVGDLLFTYGTLRPGCHAFGLFEGKAELVGLTTLPGHSIYSTGGFPGMKVDETGTVIGNLMKVTDASVFSRLDQYEGYPSLFDRKVVETVDGPAWAYTFQHPVREEQKIVSGDWLNRG